MNGAIGSWMPDVPPVNAEVERQQLEDEEDRDRHDDERVAAGAQRHEPDRDRDQPGHQAAERQQREHGPAARDVPVLRGERDGVGAGAEEHRVAEREVAGVAAEDVPRARSRP